MGNTYWLGLYKNFINSNDIEDLYIKELYSNPNRIYHNLDHLKDMFMAADALKVSYSHALYKAILYHDAVYDKEPFKERRSADLFSVNLIMSKADISMSSQKCYDLIMSTETHNIQGCSDISLILLDLFALTNFDKTISNSVKLIKEAMAIYNISELEAINGSLEFLSKFETTCYNNVTFAKNLKMSTQIIEILQRILGGIKLSQQILKLRKENHREVESEYDIF